MHQLLWFYHDSLIKAGKICLQYFQDCSFMSQVVLFLVQSVSVWISVLCLDAELINVSHTLLLTCISHLPASVMWAEAIWVQEVTNAPQIVAKFVTRLCSRQICGQSCYFSNRTSNLILCHLILIRFCFLSPLFSLVCSHVLQKYTLVLVWHIWLPLVLAERYSISVQILSVKL